VRALASKVAVVVQRYGREVLGGSEALAADIAACISKAYDVEVLTTCAKEYETWANYFPEGESLEGGIAIRRFPVDSPRHFLFKPLNVLLRSLPHTKGAERLWMRMQGPYSSRLIEHVVSHKEDYDAFVFVTYMYGTTFYCLPLVREKSVLVPTAHDEPYIRYGIYGDVFRGAGRLIYLTEEEKAFTDVLFCLGPDKGIVAGAPITSGAPSPERFRKKYGIEGEFLLYAGRLDRFKGVQMLLEYFERYVRENNSGLKLVLCGSGPMRVRENDHVAVPGFVPPEDKYDAMAAALASVVPSKFESFSYSLLESLATGTPALVNGESAVLKGHCRRSGGCACYVTYEEFKTALDGLMNEPGLRESMCEAGRNYVQESYSAEAVGKKYITAIDGLINGRRGQA
jgi:glycosyltransferase involved in cell wall biosynthesis